jgi:hypothetical protein
MHNFYSTNFTQHMFHASDFSELNKNAQYQDTISEGLVQGGN